jgi:hypothetical protein
MERTPLLDQTQALEILTMCIVEEVEMNFFLRENCHLFGEECPPPSRRCIKVLTSIALASLGVAGKDQPSWLENSLSKAKEYRFTPERK